MVPISNSLELKCFWLVPEYGLESKMIFYILLRNSSKAWSFIRKLNKVIGNNTKLKTMATTVEIQLVRREVLTSCMIILSCVKILGNNQGIDVPTTPKVNPTITPMMTSDLSSALACSNISKFSECFGKIKKLLITYTLYLTMVVIS